MSAALIIDVCAWLISLCLTLLLLCAVIEIAKLFRCGRNAIAWFIVAVLDTRCIYRGHEWFWRREDANRRYCRKCGQCERAEVNSSVWVAETPRSALVAAIAHVMKAEGK